MAYVRGQERMVTMLAFTTVRDTLMGPLGWDGVLLGRLPFQATVVPTITEHGDPKVKVDPLVKNAIGFSEGMMPNDEVLQLGDGLQSQTHTYFVDVYGENLSIAKQLAHDVRGCFTGRHGRSTIALPDYSQPGSPAMPGHLVTYDGIVTEFPESLDQRNWAVVKFTAVHEFNP